MRAAIGLLAIGLAASAAAQEAPPFAAFDMAGPAVLHDPHDLAFGPDGRLYVADKFGARIAVLDPETLEVVATHGAGLLPNVHDISFGRDGRAAIAVTGIGAVLVVEDLADLAAATVLAAPRTEGALMHSSGRVYAMASGSGRILAYEGERLVAATEGHYGAHDLAEDGQGNLWVADNFARRLVKYSPALERLQVLDAAKFGFEGPRYLDVDAMGRLVVADQDAHRVLLIDPEGPEGGSLLGVLGTGEPGEGPGLFDDPEGVAAAGNRYFIADSDNNRIVRYVVVMN
ncbi:MAG TPA: NHL repeat-containing protein [Amaricoccus sp.]|uniref:Vgb family protein n=1 Tax=Amaricoccus sp. TaxID=1872485 RepID=UPI002C313C73|nr:NHL repeat-containing protein [Amaricoccus sp.]HPG23298.1 NHL repeat-containing protein [Amaricoccus sp.]HRW14238.1 NHL repeat-containing protein [Amaricoccus sp.]